MGDQSASVFELLREQIPIGRVLEADDHDKIRCISPEHEDSDPSMHVYPEHVHCFGCGFHGDVVDVWGAQRGHGRPIEAALDLAGEFGVQLPEFSKEARVRAEKKRGREDAALRLAKACHAALERHAGVLEWWEGRGFGGELRERFLLGANRDGTEAVIPFWVRGGRVVGVIRRKLEGKPKYRYPEAKDLPDGRKPLFVPGRVGREVFITESITDALAVAATGRSAIAVGGTGITDAQRAELRPVLPEGASLYILPHPDESGADAAREWAREFFPMARVCGASYGGGKDIADAFTAEGAEGTGERLDRLGAEAFDAVAMAVEEAKGADQLAAYRTAKEAILPLLLRLGDEGEQDALLHDVSKKLKMQIKPLRKALAAMREAEKERREEKAAKAEEVDDDAIAANAPEPGTERYDRAMQLLKDRRLLSRFAVDAKRLGHVGEFMAKKLSLVCGVSARAGRAIQPSTHAQSAAGKNYLWDTTLSLFPPEMVVRRSGLSAKALFRTRTNLKGAVLYIQEVAGSEDAEYTLRIMQSDGRLEYEATEKQPDGSLKNVVHTTEGPTVVVQTTTKNHLHPENETRVFPIYIDESEEQTARIVKGIKRQAAGNRPNPEEEARIRERWHDALRLLRPVEVVIPFAERIQIPSSPLRIRRDAQRLMDVIRVNAWLHQHQRDRDSLGRIEATEKDFEEALALVRESLWRAWQTLSPAEEAVLRAMRKLDKGKQRGGFKRRDLKVPGYKGPSVKAALKSLTESGYLDCDGRSGPQGYTYTLGQEVEKISLGISLYPIADSEETPTNTGETNGYEQDIRSYPVSDSGEEDDEPSDNGYDRINGEYPIESADLQEEHAHRLSDMPGEEEKNSHPAPEGKRRELTPEEAERVKRLMAQGMSPKWARAQVFGEDPPQPNQ